MCLTYTLIGVSKRICTKLPKIAQEHSDQLPLLISFLLHSDPTACARAGDKTEFLLPLLLH